MTDERTRVTGLGPQRGNGGKVRRAVSAFLTAILFLGVLGVAGWVLVANLTRPGPHPAAQPLAHRSTPAAATAVSAPPLAPDPFTGSPADSYASGAAGIVPPPAHRVGPYPAAQVRRAYATVKKMLIAAHLDHRTLLGGRPAAFARLLIPAERRFFDHHLNSTGLTRHGTDRSTRTWVSSFAPGVQFSTDVVKVHGFMSARAITAPGGPVLRIRTDYLFVYAVQRPYQPTTRVRVVDREEASVDFAQWDDPQGPLEPWWNAGEGAVAGSRCSINDGFIHPDFPGGPPDRTQPSGKPANPYDQSGPPGRGCQASTGT